MNYEIKRNIKGEPRAIEFDDTDTANKFLASPDMYAVLTQFVRYCQQWQNSNGEFPNGDGRILILKNAMQALAKAEGK